MFENLSGIRNPADRREALIDELDTGYQLTDVMLSGTAHRVAALEAIQGIVIERSRPMKLEPERPEQFRFATVDGEPLGKIKIGGQLRSIPADKLLQMHQRKQSADIFAEYPADFEVGGERAILILNRHGFGFPEPRYYCRHAQGRKELDAYGNPVIAIDRWRVVEVGSVFAEQAADELVGKASSLGDTEKRAVLERALHIYPGHRAAESALEQMPARKRKAS